MSHTVNPDAARCAGHYRNTAKARSVDNPPYIALTGHRVAGRITMAGIDNTSTEGGPADADIARQMREGRVTLTPGFAAPSARRRPMRLAKGTGS